MVSALVVAAAFAAGVSPLADSSFASTFFVLAMGAPLQSHPGPVHRNQDTPRLYRLCPRCPRTLPAADAAVAPTTAADVTSRLGKNPAAG
jgi:hypothetical protein